MHPGIYGIENIQNGLVYIGSANKMKYRLGTHRSNFRGGRHENQHLQHAYNLWCSSKKIWLTGHIPKRWRCDDCGKTWKMNNEKVKK